MKLFLAGAFARHWDGRDPFAAVADLQGQVYRQLDGRTTLRFDVEGRGYFAKIHRGVGLAEVLKNLLYLRLPVVGAESEWRAITRLHELGVDTLQAVAFGSRGWLPWRRFSFLITEALEPTEDLESILRMDSRTSDAGRRTLSSRQAGTGFLTQNPEPRTQNATERRALARKLGSITRILHENGINHRDYYLCHFLVDTTAESAGVPLADRTLSLIDLHRVQIRRHTPRRWRVKDLASLYYSARLVGLSRRDVIAFWREYRGGASHRGPITAGEHRLWRRVRKKAAALYKKGERKGYHQRLPSLPSGRESIEPVEKLDSRLRGNDG